MLSTIVAVGFGGAAVSADPLPTVPDGVYLGGGGWVAPTTDNNNRSVITVWNAGTASCDTSISVSFNPDAAGSTVALESWGIGWNSWGTGRDYALPLGLSGTGTVEVSCVDFDGNPISLAIPLNITSTTPTGTYHSKGQYTIYRQGDTVTVDKVGYLPGETVTIVAYDPSLYHVNYDFSEGLPFAVTAVADGEGAISARFAAPSGWDGQDVGAVSSSASSHLLFDTDWEDSSDPTVDVDFSSSPSAPPGGTIAVSGTGFLANETVVIALHSASAPAVVLGTTTANGSGAISTTATIPSNLALGNYRIWAGAKTLGYLLSSAPLIVEEPHFADAGAPTDAFYPYIQWMSTTGISTGTPQSSGQPIYKPLDAVSRQAMAQFMYRVSGETFVAPAEPTFADVDASSQFYTAIEWMSASAISTGTPQETGKPLYKPSDPVSRQAMALFLARYAHIDVSTAPTEQAFADVATNGFGAAAITWMKQTEISTGTTQPSGLPLYKPVSPVSRQAMAAFLYRLEHL